MTGCDQDEPHIATVTPITETHTCASCKAEIDCRRVFEGHTDACMQPEIRMRRTEATLAHLRQVVYQLVGSNNDNVTSIVAFNKRLDELDRLFLKSVKNAEAMGYALADVADQLNTLTDAFDALVERVRAVEGMTRQHGSSKEPTTQRSEHADDVKPYVTREEYIAEHERVFDRLAGETAARRQARANASPAESPGEAPTGAELAGDEPERAG